MEAKKKADAGDWFDRAMRALTLLLLVYIATVGPQPAKVVPAPTPAPVVAPVPEVLPLPAPTDAFEKRVMQRFDELELAIEELAERTK